MGQMCKYQAHARYSACCYQSFIAESKRLHGLSFFTLLEILDLFLSFDISIFRVLNVTVRSKRNVHVLAYAIEVSDSNENLIKANESQAMHHNQKLASVSYAFSTG